MGTGRPTTRKLCYRDLARRIAIMPSALIRGGLTALYTCMEALSCTVRLKRPMGPKEGHMEQRGDISPSFGPIGRFNLTETPYGPKRGAYGTTWRYKPGKHQLDLYVSYP